MRLPLLLVLAAGTDVTPGASVVAALPAQAMFDLTLLPHWAQVGLAVLAALGSIVGPSSLIANFLNNLIRAKRMNGEKPSSLLLAVASTVNRTALNFSKGARLAKAAKEPKP